MKKMTKVKAVKDASDLLKIESMKKDGEMVKRIKTPFSSVDAAFWFNDLCIEWGVPPSPHLVLIKIIKEELKEGIE